MMTATLSTPADRLDAVVARAEGSASDEARPRDERVAAGLAGAEGSASDEAHPSEENRRADERGNR